MIDLHPLRLLRVSRWPVQRGLLQPLASTRHSTQDCVLTLTAFWLGLLSLTAGSEQSPARLKPAPSCAARTLPDAVDLRPAFKEWGLVARQQGNRGTCSVFVLTSALEFAAASKQHHGERFSVEFLNWGAQKIVGKAKDGGYFSDLWSAFAVYGICLEGTLPYRAEFDPALAPAPEVLAEAKTRLALGLRRHWIKEWNVKTGLTGEQLLAVKQTLSLGWPVCGGLRWPTQPQWSHDVLQMCPADAVYDGHSVLLVGYRDGTNQLDGVFIFRNTNKDGRDGQMPYSYAQSYMNDAMWIDSDAQTPPP